MKDLRISKDFTPSQIIVNQSTNEDKIEGEIEQLRTQFSKAQASNDTAWNSSVLRVLFKNETFARKYKVRIEKFLKDLLDEGEEFVVYHPTRTNGEQEFEDNHQSFHIDKVKDGSFDDSEILQKVPFYSAAYEDTLKRNIDETEEKNEEVKPSRLTCFNCLGNHHMKKCPEKLDRARINANKNEILLSGNSMRYHIGEQNNSLKPGKLSDNLRDALGLKKNQLPQFIYHMRVIGYPPGWMNEAVFEQSGLSLYDSDGKAVMDEHSMPSSSATGTLYDGTKFIDFPGFNSPVPEGFMDEWKALDMPPLQPHQLLKEALKSPNIIINSNINKRKQILCNNDIDSKKLKNAEKPSSPFSKVKVTENDCTSPEHRGKTCDFKSPDSKQTNKRHSMSISMSPGTPVLEQGNPYHKLPEANKFAEGITEHLPFENLPDSVGTFEKMREVISSVQKKLIDFKKS